MLVPHHTHTHSNYVNIFNFSYGAISLETYDVGINHGNKQRDNADNPRNSAQLIVQAHNLSIKSKIDKFQSMGETCKDPTPCSIVITEADDGKVVDESDGNANRLSIVSSSSVESSRSDNNDEEIDVNIEHGSSVFYVVWD